MADITVMVLDDHEVVRRGICDIIDRADGFAVVAEAANVAQGIRRAVAVRPQVILSDLRLPDGTGLDVIQQVRKTLPETRVVVLTSYDDDEARAAARAAGADVFLAKTAGSSEVLQAVRDAASGGVVKEQVFLRTGQKTFKTVRLKGRGTVRVKVVDSLGAPVEQAFVKLREGEYPTRTFEGVITAAGPAGMRCTRFQVPFERQSRSSYAIARSA